MDAPITPELNELTVRPPAVTADCRTVDLPEEPQGGLLEYWRIIRRRRNTVFVIAIAGLALGVLVTLPQTPLYQARTTLEIQDLNQDFMNMKEVSPVTESQNYSAMADIQTQIKILQSDTLAERTRGKLATFPASPPRPSLFHLRLGYSPNREAELKRMSGALKVRAAGQTRIIELLVDSNDPALAAAYANTMTNEFIQQNMEARWEMSQRTGDWLSRQMEDMRIKLERSETALQNYARQNGLMFTATTGGDDKSDRTGTVSQQKLSQVQEELSKAQADRMERQSRYELATKAPVDTLPDVLNDGGLRDLQAKLTDLQRQQAELGTTFKPDYSKVKRIQAQIATLQAALEQERSFILSRVRNDYDQALSREKLLEQAYASQAGIVTADSEKAIQYNILKREVDSNRQLYESMLQHVKESAIASAMKASNVRVVDAATIPKEPYKPELPMNAGLGLLAGSFLGIAFVVMRERADRSLKQPGDAPFYLDVPELGVIPSASTSRRRLYYYSRKEDEGDTRPPHVLLPGGPEKTRSSRVELITLDRKPSATAEAFRTVLTSILFSGENGSRPRVLAITSPGPAEGKTTVASNLAIALAEIGRKVLLIDADMRRPRVHSIFHLDNETGLSTLLNTPSERIKGDSVVRPTVVPNLFAIPSGPSSLSAANLLFSPTMQKLIAEFRTEFDMVLIDTPPTLQMTDARVIGRLSDAIILVIRANKTTVDAATAARKRFGDDRIRVLGTILNDWDPRRSPNGYYGYYKAYNQSEQYRHDSATPNT